MYNKNHIVQVQDFGHVNNVNLCDSCLRFSEIPECIDCPILGTGKGLDNIVACSNYSPIKLNPLMEELKNQ